MSVLLGKPEFKWLYDHEGCLAGRVEPRFTILAELGRLKNPEVIRAAARQLCKDRPRSKVAVAWLRRLRLDSVREGPPRPGPGDADVANALITALNDFMATHPGTRWADAVEGVELMRDSIVGQWYRGELGDREAG
jgi:hypothetical protein